MSKHVRFGRIAIDPEKLRTVIIEQRTRLGLSHRALAQKAGVAPTTVYNLEQGKYKLQLDKFLAVLGALDLVPENVIEIDNKLEILPESELERQVKEIALIESPEQMLARLSELVRSIRDNKI